MGHPLSRHCRRGCLRDAAARTITERRPEAPPEAAQRHSSAVALGEDMVCLRLTWPPQKFRKPSKPSGASSRPKSSPAWHALSVTWASPRSWRRTPSSLRSSSGRNPVSRTSRAPGSWQRGSTAPSTFCGGARASSKSRRRWEVKCRARRRSGRARRGAGRRSRR